MACGSFYLYGILDLVLVFIVSFGSRMRVEEIIVNILLVICLFTAGGLAYYCARHRKSENIRNYMIGLASLIFIYTICFIIGPICEAMFFKAES
jgi:hypothetical protein|mmetsp:Transcript_22179/g.3685  ORF Transcript_22179/g.3685 Transcript_22179/m.3685 type:complete len:94 (-) Transcript_22179:1297-1578(-)